MLRNFPKQLRGGTNFREINPNQMWYVIFYNFPQINAIKIQKLNQKIK